MGRRLTAVALAGVLAACSGSSSSTGAATSVAETTSDATTTAVPVRSSTTTSTTVARTTTVGPTTTGAPVAAPSTIYAVGTHSVDLVDPSRPTPPNGSAAGAPDRTFSTLVVYPAVGGPSAPPAEDAPAAEAPYGFPVVVYAHGLGGGALSSMPILTRLAAAGFVVAAPELPLSKHDAPGGSSVADYGKQPADISFVIGEVVGGRAGPLPVVDGGRVAVAGHSLGAMTVLGLTQNSCCHDDRIKAAVAISGMQLVWGGAWYQPPTTPLLLIHGDQDPIVPFKGSTDVFASASSPVALVRLLGAPHWVFGPPYVDVVATTMVDFLRAELDDDADASAALAVDGNQPGRATLQQR
jgi:alpha-beta hydrolase superfamily lysophospholipase